MCRFASFFEIVMALDLCQDFASSIPKWMKQNLTYALILMRCVGIVMRKIFAMPLTHIRTLSTILKMNGWS